MGPIGTAERVEKGRSLEVRVGTVKMFRAMCLSER